MVVGSAVGGWVGGLVTGQVSGGGYRSGPVKGLRFTE